MIHTHDNISGNYVCLMLVEMEPLHIGISTSLFCNDINQFCFVEQND